MVNMYKKTTFTIQPRQSDRCVKIFTMQIETKKLSPIFREWNKIGNDDVIVSEKVGRGVLYKRSPRANDLY